MTLPVSNWSVSVGRALYAAATIFFGVQHFIYGAFVTRIMPAWPAWVPVHPIWPYAVGAMLVVLGSGLFFERTARMAALGLGWQTLLAAVLLALPPALTHEAWGGEWTNAGKAFALGGGAFVVAASLTGGAGNSVLAKLLPLGRVGLSGFMFLGGIQHYLWAQNVSRLVPTWIPGPIFWTYLAGTALMAGGIGMLLRPTARLAAWLSARMIFTWIIVLHAPRVAANLHNANEATAMFEALAFSGIALLVAGGPRQSRAD